MRFVRLALLLIATGLASPALPSAAELVMVEKAGCVWCRQWHAAIGPIYPKTGEARIAPLRRIDIADPALADLQLASPPRLTPTFILVDGDREIGRIEGYPGEDFFWGLLARLLEKLPKEDAGGS